MTRIPYLYIAGTSYCGSTLLAFLLNAHPRMASISEPAGPIPNTDYDTYRCSCGALFVECPFYQKLEKRINEQGSRFQLRDWQTHFRMSHKRWLDIPLVRPLRNATLEQVRDAMVPLYRGYGRKIAEIAIRNSRLAQAVLEILGKDVYVDAQKDSIRIKFLKQSGLFDLKVIHLVRDVRGAVTSFMKHNDCNDAAWAARMWRTQNMNADRARRYVEPGQWMRLNYDEICTDPQGTYHRLADFSGVERSTLPVDFYDVEHHIIGNSMRLRGDGRIRHDESWKGKLSEKDLGVVASVAGRENRYWGHVWPD